MSKKNFAVLVCLVYLCFAVFCQFAYPVIVTNLCVYPCLASYICAAVLCYVGCYYVNYIWMPPLGYIMDYSILPLFVQENLQFQRYHLRRYGPVPVNIRIELFLVSFLWTNRVRKLINEG